MTWTSVSIDRRLLKVVFWLRPLNFNLPVYLEIYEASRGNMLYNVTTTAKKSLASGDYKYIHFHLVCPLTTVPVYRSAQRAALFSSRQLTIKVIKFEKHGNTTCRWGHLRYVLGESFLVSLGYLRSRNIRIRCTNCFFFLWTFCVFCVRH